VPQPQRHHPPLRGHDRGASARHTNSKNTPFNNFELFRLNDPSIPVEMLEVKDQGALPSHEDAVGSQRPGGGDHGGVAHQGIPFVLFVLLELTIAALVGSAAKVVEIEAADAGGNYATGRVLRI